MAEHRIGECSRQVSSRRCLGSPGPGPTLRSCMNASQGRAVLPAMAVVDQAVQGGLLLVLEDCVKRVEGRPDLIEHL